jgi:hypothetical protein
MIDELVIRWALVVVVVTIVTVVVMVVMMSGKC